MTKNLFLDLLREVRKSANRFFSILIIVAIGVAFFAGLRSSAPDMAYTMDGFFDEYNIADIQVVSTLGLSEEDIDVIRNTDGVKEVQPGYFTDALINFSGTEAVVRVHSFPDNYEENPKSFINQFSLIEGRLPQSDDELVLEKSEYIYLGVEIGDQISLSSGTDTPLTDGTLKNDTFTVVGFVQTPYYITYEKGTSQINSLSIDLYAYVMADAFAYEDVYIEALVNVEGAKALNCFDKNYTKLIENTAIELKNIGVDRSMIRGNQIRGYAEQQLAEAQENYDTQLADFNKQIEEGQKKLDDGYTELIKGENDLKNGKERYESEVASAEQQIADGEKQLASGRKQLADAREQLAGAKVTLNDARAQYNDAMASTEDARSMLASATNALESMKDSMASLEYRMNSTDDPELRAEYAELYSIYQGTYESVNSTYLEAKEMNDSVSDVASSAQSMFNDASAAVADAERTLNEAQAEVNASQTELDNGRAELARRKVEAQQEFEDAQKKLDDGWAEYNDGKKEFEEKKAEGEKQLSEGNDQLIAAKYEIEKISNAQWYMLDRTKNYSYASYKGTVDRMKALASIIPIFFILVAVLVCVTTMTRMVSDQRGVIGTYKALGYANNAIASKYILYVLVASVIGAVIGAVVGVKLFPNAVYEAWSALYVQPKLSQVIHWGEIILSFVITIIAMVLTAYFTCRMELKSVPAQLMRPKAPKVGKKILLERIGFIWNKLSFSKKVTMRNIFRYKSRLFMTVLGIMGCTALLMAGFGMNDTISSVIDNQFHKVFKFDYLITTEDDDEMDAAKKVLDDHNGQYIDIGAGTVTVAKGNDSLTASMYITDDPEAFNQFILLEDRVTEKPLSIENDGIVLSEKLCEGIGAKVGDFVDVTDYNNITKSVQLVGIAENYVFHYAYMQETTYIDCFLQGLEKSTILAKIDSDNNDTLELKRELQDAEGVISVLLYSEVAADFNEQIKAMKSIILLILVCAALLAFVVLYNLTNINVSERVREIATIKVLGFKRKEVAMYIYRENFILTLIGAFFGLFCGIGLHRVIIKAIEQDYVMFGYTISPLSFVYSVVLTCVFSIIVMLYMYRRIVNVPMVESLKSVE